LVAHEKRNSGQLFCTVPTRNDLALSSLLFSAQPTQKLGYPFPGSPPLDGSCRLPYNGAKPPPPSPGEERTYTMKKALIVVDMQKDFVDGSLGTPAAQSIVPAVVEKIRAFRGDALLVTLDTHGADYLQTLEGKKLPTASRAPPVTPCTVRYRRHYPESPTPSWRKTPSAPSMWRGSLRSDSPAKRRRSSWWGSARTSASSPMRCSSAPPSRTPPSPWTPAAAPA